MRLKVSGDVVSQAEFSACGRYRYTLERRTQTVSTPYGAVRQKISSGYGVQRQKAEYEDIATIAREQGLSIAQVREMLK